MSGFEVAGLVLGLYPIVVSAVDSCERGFGVLADWKQFRREFTEFSNRLRGQQILLRQHIEFALRSISDSEVQLAAMMNDPGSTSWKEFKLTNRLRVKLSGDGEFDTYCETLGTVHAHLKKLDKRLEVHRDVNKAATTSSRINLQKEFRKLMFCYQKKKLTEEVSIISEQIDILGKLLGNAEILEPTRKTRQSTISQIFEQVRSQASSLHRAISRAWTCSCTEKHAFELLLTRRKQRSKEEAVPDALDRRLRVAFPFRAQDQNPKSPEECQHTTLPDSRQPPQTKHSWCTTETMMVMDHVPESKPCSALLRPGLERYHSASSLHSETTLSPASSDTQLRKTSAVSTETLIDDLCQKIKIWDKAEPFLGYLPDGLGAHHALHIAQDLGAATKGVSGIISLGDVLKGVTRRSVQMPRKTRMSVALMISYAILELHSSPWIQERWDNKDIYFWVEGSGTIIADHPFLVSLTRDEEPTGQSRKNSDTLLSLGILIMELWFNQTLKSQPCWAANFGPDGKETEFTRFSAAATWQKKMNEDAGICLHNITRRCIYGDFGLDTQDLGDWNFTRAVYDGVVKELESVVAMFE